MFCRLRYPRDGDPVCGQTMITRAGPSGSVLHVCPVHDGDATNPAATHPAYNRPRPGGRGAG